MTRWIVALGGALALAVPAAAQSAINVFSLKKADAVQTATLLRQLFTGATTTGGGGAFGGVAAGNAGTAGQQRPLLALAGAVGEGAALIDLRISVDDRTNSLIVAGSLNDLDMIRTLIVRLEAADVQQRMFDIYRLRNAAAPAVRPPSLFIESTLGSTSGPYTVQ